MISKIFKITVNSIMILLVLLGILVIFSFFPFPGNYKIFTVQSGSMEPAIHTGSLIFVKPVSDYKIGDVITKKTSDPKVSVTHRIVETKERDGKISYITKGDANDGQDMEDASKNQIIGKVIAVLPFLGYPVGYAKTTPGLIILIVIPAVIIIYDEMNKIKGEIRKKIEDKKKVKEDEKKES